MEPGSGSERMRRLWWWWWWCVQFKYESIWVTFVVLIPLDQMSSPFHINTFNCVGMRLTWLLLRHRQLEDLLLNQLLPCDVTCDACLAPAELNKWRQTTSLYAITSSLCSTFRPFVPHFVPLSLFLHKGTSLYLCTPEKECQMRNESFLLSLTANKSVRGLNRIHTYKMSITT